MLEQLKVAQLSAIAGGSFNVTSPDAWKSHFNQTEHKIGPDRRLFLQCQAQQMIEMRECAMLQAPTINVEDLNWPNVNGVPAWTAANETHLQDLLIESGDAVRTENGALAFHPYNEALTVRFSTTFPFN